MRLSTNALGLRGAPINSLPKAPTLFLGDSFTMGYGVSDGEEYPAIVAARLKQQVGATAPPVVNAGIGDSGNGRRLKLLASLAEQVEPRLVVMQVLDNDFTDNISERFFDLDGDGRLRELAIPSPGFARRFQAVIEAVPGLASTNLVGLLRWNTGGHVQAADRLMPYLPRKTPVSRP